MNPTWIYTRRLAGLRPHTGTVDLKEFARLGKFRVHPKKEIRCVCWPSLLAMLIAYSRPGCAAIPNCWTQPLPCCSSGMVIILGRNTVRRSWKLKSYDDHSRLCITTQPGNCDIWLQSCSRSAKWTAVGDPVEYIDTLGPYSKTTATKLLES